MSTRAHVLVVDDDRAFRAALGRLLTPHAVTEAADARAALALCEDGAIDVVIADVRMWPIDGLELAAELQRRGLELPVVVVTAADPDEVRAMIEALALRHVVDVLSKPVTAAAIAGAIGRGWDAQASVPTARDLKPVTTATR